MFSVKAPRCAGLEGVSRVTADWYSDVLICLGSHTCQSLRLDAYACPTGPTRHEDGKIELAQDGRAIPEQTPEFAAVTHTGTPIATDAAWMNCEMLTLKRDKRIDAPGWTPYEASIYSKFLFDLHSFGFEFLPLAVGERPRSRCRSSNPCWTKKDKRLTLRPP